MWSRHQRGRIWRWKNSATGEVLEGPTEAEQDAQELHYKRWELDHYQRTRAGIDEHIAGIERRIKELCAPSSAT